MTEGTQTNSQAGALGPLSLRVFLSHSVRWIEHMVGTTIPIPSDLLAAWLESVQGIFAGAQTPADLQFVAAVAGIVERVPKWTTADIEVAQAENWQWPAASADVQATSQRTRMAVDRNLERFQAATAGTVAAQHPLLRQLLEAVQEEQQRLGGAQHPTLTATPPPDSRGALSREYLELVVATWSMPHYAPTGVWGRGWKPPARIELGLSDGECAAIETRFGFSFPHDVRSLLQFAVPVGEGFSDWRDGKSVEAVLERIPEGICFDVEHNDVWTPEWGPRPETLAAAVAIVRELLAQAPRLIPLLQHRCIPDRPPTAGNPVYSIVQTDIIVYGNDLAGYLHQEFGVPRPVWSATAPRDIAFWSDMVRRNDG